MSAEEKKTLKIWRVTKGYSQKELGEKLGVAQSVVANWENGKYQLNKIKKLAIANVLDIKDYRDIL